LEVLSQALEKSPDAEGRIVGEEFIDRPGMDAGEKMLIHA
jgi:hypothetical protein